ncbi:hypothetical protein Tco_0026907 [Tanacetum coccineum]
MLVPIAKESSQLQSSYEAAATLTEFELKKILIDKMDKSESYLAVPEHKECYEGLKKIYDLDKTIFSTYGKVYSLKRSRKDKDEDPSTGSNRGLKKRKTGKDAAPATCPKAKESQSGSSKGDKSRGEPRLFQKKLDWKNPKGGDYPFDLTKPLSLVMSRNRQKVLVDYFFNNDLKYLQGGILTMTYTTSLTKTNAAQYDLLENNIWLTNLSGDDISDFAMALRMFTRSLVIQKRNRLMRSDELYKFSDRTLTGIQTSLDDITKNILMECLPKRRWSTLEKKRANIMIKAIDKQLKERRLMRSLKKFVGGRHYGTNLRLLQRTM